MAKELVLTRGKVALVDDEDFDWLSQWRWFALRKRTKSGDLWYAVRNCPGRGKGMRLMHREIAIHCGLPSSRYYDHWDGDGLNNQRHNLRPCTQSQNQANRRKGNPCATSSRFKGVSWNNRRSRWIAEITYAGRRYYLGGFTSETEAAGAYMAAARDAFGEFAHP